MANNNNQIVLLGDLKGTKSHLESNQYEKLTNQLSYVHHSFSLTFLSFFERSRNLSCYSFSDSVIAKWTDPKEGFRYCVPFAVEFFKGLNDVPYRIFIDMGIVTDEKMGYSKLLDSVSGRYINITPVSIALWSVSKAEASHFPEGIFVGEKVAEFLNKQFEFKKTFVAGKFFYKQLVVPV